MVWHAPGRVDDQRSRRGRWLWALLCLAVGGACATLMRTGTEDALLAAQGCADVAECRDLVAQTEARADSCTFSCGAQQRDYRTARGLLRQVLENEAAKRYAEQEESARSTKQAQALTQAKIAQAERKDALLALERARAHELELLAFQAEQRRLSDAAERAAKLAYFQQLSLDQKQGRLDRCYEAGLSCDDLAALLIDSTDSAKQRRTLVQLNEDYASGRLPEAEVPQRPSSKVPNKEATAAAPARLTSSTRQPEDIL